MKGGYVYIVTNRPHGTLYVGVTADLVRRIWGQRNGSGSPIVRRYGLTRLVFWEFHEATTQAIQREAFACHDGRGDRPP